MPALRRDAAAAEDLPCLRQCLLPGRRWARVCRVLLGAMRKYRPNAALQRTKKDRKQE
jgi:hypothetical protein